MLKIQLFCALNIIQKTLRWEKWPASQAPVMEGQQAELWMVMTTQTTIRIPVAIHVTLLQTGGGLILV